VSEYVELVSLLQRLLTAFCGVVGLAQGVRRIFAQFGLILGPLWAGSMIDRPYYMFAVMLAVNILLMVSSPSPSVFYVLMQHCS